MGEFQEDFGRIWEDLAGFRQKVGWIRQSRVDFGGKSWILEGIWWFAPALPRRKPGANVAQTWRCLAECARPIPKFLSEEFSIYHYLTLSLLTRLRPSMGVGRNQSLRAFRQARVGGGGWLPIRGIGGGGA